MFFTHDLTNPSPTHLYCENMLWINKVKMLWSQQIRHTYEFPRVNVIGL